MIGKFFLKYGPGSPGQTAKTLINHFNLRNQMYMKSEPNKIYEDILADRMLIAERTGQSYYGRMYDIEKVMEFIDNDISTFTFFVLFAESKNFRDGVLPNKYGDSSFKEVTEVIYKVCKKRSVLCIFNLKGFQDKADRICRLHIFNF